MNLNSFVVQEARSLPVFLLVDTSGSMKGPKIDTVNAALREMLQVLSHLQGTKGQIKLNIVTFGDTVNVVQKLENVQDVQLELLQTKGKTPMGEAIECVIKMIEDEEIVPPRAYSPMIILISDGLATDCPRGKEELNTFQYSEWAPIKHLQESPKTVKCTRLALGIGVDAEYNLLRAFINNPQIPIIKAQEAATITKFFKWVTQSITRKSVSNNPNTCETISAFEVFEDLEIEF